MANKTMNHAQLERYRKQLLELSEGVRENVSDTSEQARQPTGGQADGGLSNTPMHLADMGTETYLQELGSTLLESEQELSYEISDALQRIDDGTFGTCEECGQPIPKARLDALPYSRHCVQCADTVVSAPRANLNVGRPQRPRDTFASRASPPLERPAEAATGLSEEHPIPDSAVGTAGGGTAVGGLAGTNMDAGDPEDLDLDKATSSGNFNPESDGGQTRYSGHSGGAAGGASGVRA